MPGLWSILYEDYQKGKLAPSLHSLRIEDCLSDLTDDLRKKYTFASRSRVAETSKSPRREEFSSRYTPALIS